MSVGGGLIVRVCERRMCVVLMSKGLLAYVGQLCVIDVSGG